ncbi:OmpA family protein [Sedimentitalea nanhaiensis]|uniref:Outer membrane protein OmpA n=1 Tax=Sedimentitalea nanhaiensis TaxID=999627 RepID=A0A1I7AXY5_9RHOB|nr:OmpA family protein [Sedimentitalea nanhaiensis]SFT79749.1 Outer membrane protein OmpA [Sedimentitalea nanhaiensis]
MQKLILAAGMTLTLAGCAQEAGDFVRTGDFGEATMNNGLVMRGDKSYAISLGQRFARETPTTVNFAFNSDRLDGEAQQILDRQADWIRQFPEVRFAVYGYTDEVGTQSYNYGLGRRRATAVVRYLSSRGINRSRLKALVSYGETRPVIDVPGPERANRRSVTEVAGFVERHPTVLDGKYAEVIYREYVISAQPIDRLTRRNNTGGFGETQ